MCKHPRISMAAILAAVAVAVVLIGGAVCPHTPAARGYGRVLQAAQRNPEPRSDATTDMLMAMVLARHQMELVSRLGPHAVASDELSLHVTRGS